MDWRKSGAKIVPADELLMNAPQMSGMTRVAAITDAKPERRPALWAGTMVVQPDAKTGPLRWGARLELNDDAGAGDCIYVPRIYRSVELMLIQ